MGDYIHRGSANYSFLCQLPWSQKPVSISINMYYTPSTVKHNFKIFVKTWNKQKGLKQTLPLCATCWAFLSVKMHCVNILYKSWYTYCFPTSFYLITHIPDGVRPPAVHVPMNLFPFFYLLFFFLLQNHKICASHQTNSWPKLTN